MPQTILLPGVKDNLTVYFNSSNTYVYTTALTHSYKHNTHTHTHTLSLSLSLGEAQNQRLSRGVWTPEARSAVVQSPPRKATHSRGRTLFSTSMPRSTPYLTVRVTTARCLSLHHTPATPSTITTTHSSSPSRAEMGAFVPKLFLLLPT